MSKYYGWAKNELFYKDLTKHKTWQPFAVGHDAKFYATAWNSRIFVHTNYQAPRWRLLEVDPAKPEISEWKEIVAEHPKSVLEDTSIVGDHHALSYLENASSRLELATLDGKPLRIIQLPGIGMVHGPSGNPEDDTFYYAFSSFTTPVIVYESSVAKGGATTYFELDVPVDPEPYTVEQVWYPSKDGTKISMFIVHRKDMKKDGSTPLFLTGYGGFNISQTPHFSAPRFVWYERGGAFAIPNLRGGGEYGEQWHRDGMRENKQNVFDDFIGAAEFLIREGYTKSDRLAIAGASNGGLLVGAAMVQRPELFRAVVCNVPLLDMVRYHLFGSGQTWISEYGSADDPTLFEVLYGYSPYHHVKKGTSYPSMLMMTADSDDRVDPLHARKFTAAIRWATSNDRNILLRLETNAGHGGGDMVKKRVEQDVDMYQYLFHELGVAH
jgi:prolyl oligopeptidase